MSVSLPGPRLASACCGRGCRELLELPHCLALGCGLQAQFAARISFAVERLGHCCRATHFAQGEDFDFKFAGVVSDAQHVADVNFAGGFRRLPVGLNASQAAGASR